MLGFYFHFCHLIFELCLLIFYCDSVLSKLYGKFISAYRILCFFGHNFAFSTARLPAICCPVYNDQAIYPSFVIPAKAGIHPAKGRD